MLRLPRDRDELARGMPVFPVRSKQIFHTYSEAFSITSGAGSAGTYVFSANGLYDPNITGTGHQPMGFDQMMLFYEHYVVQRAKISVVFKNFSSTYTTNVSIARNASTSAITNYDQLMEDGNIVHAMLAPKFNTGYMKTLTQGIDVARFGGVSNLFDRDDYQGTTTANPAEASYFHLSVWNPEDTSAVSVTCVAMVEYEVVYLEPRKLTQS